MPSEQWNWAVNADDEVIVTLPADDVLEAAGLLNSSQRQLGELGAVAFVRLLASHCREAKAEHERQQDEQAAIEEQQRHETAVYRLWVQQFEQQLNEDRARATVEFRVNEEQCDGANQYDVMVDGQRVALLYRNRAYGARRGERSTTWTLMLDAEHPCWPQQKQSASATFEIALGLCDCVHEAQYGDPVVLPVGYHFWNTLKEAKAALSARLRAPHCRYRYAAGHEHRLEEITDG
jgi:hypothetical protein